MGKPNPQIFEIIIREHPRLREASLSKFLMVGDNLKTDIKFGNNCGIDTLVVLSGNTNLEMALEAANGSHPENGIPKHIMPYFGFTRKLLPL
jgi:phosphoglycolate phosphatase